MEIVKIEYHGQTIQFDDKKEVWHITANGKRQDHKSLQMIKNYIDRGNKKAFVRVPVYVPQRGSYSWRGGDGYEEAEITSVGIDGTIFIVRKGSKSAEHCGYAYVRSDRNAEIIEKLKELNKAKEDIAKQIQSAEKSMKEVDLDKLKRVALGEAAE